MSTVFLFLLEKVIPPDGGPVYAETDLSRFIVEPWNAASSIALIIPAIFCLYLIRRNFRRFRFIILASVLLILGGTGSTLYHAFRSSPLFLLMDVLPIQLLTLSAIIYFWLKAFNLKWSIIPIVLLFIGIKLIIYYLLVPPASNNLSYLINGIMLFVPTLAYLYKTHFHNAVYIFVSIALFAISLFFRQYDNYKLADLPMGTHWLWHIFSAAGAGFLGYYLYKMKATGEEELLK